MTKKLAALVLLPALAVFSVSAAAAWRQRDQHPGDHPQSSHRQDQHQDYRGDRNSWNGQRYYWHGRPYWRLDIRRFPRDGWPVWQRGRWYHGWYGGRVGWWWVAGGAWYYYSAPVYPYPNPYVPGTVVVVNPPSAAPPPPPAQPPMQYWYHCQAPNGYYPYVPECPGGWTAVPAIPPPAATPPRGSH